MNKIFSKTPFFLPIFLMVPYFASAAPSVSGVSGTVSNGNNITISGSGFGIHGNFGSSYLPAAFKDFEDDSLTSQGFSATGANPNVVSIQNGGPTNSINYEQGKYVDGRLAGYGITQSGNNSSSIYTSFWFMQPSTPDTGKPWRWYFGPNSSNDDLYLGVSNSDGSLNMAGDVMANAGPPYTIYGSSIPTGWHKLEVYASVPNDTYKIWVDGVAYLDFASSGVDFATFINNNATMSPNGHTVEFPDMIDGTTTGSFNFDDIYIDYTPARVEICDGSTWASRGICNTQISTVWNSNGQSITASVNKGTFASGAQKYLYVVDSTDTANSNGYSITFGSGTSDTTSPAAPSGLSVV